jgi:hypothetical protein
LHASADAAKPHAIIMWQLTSGRTTTNLKFAGEHLFLQVMNAKDDLQSRWWNLEAKLLERFGKKPDLESLLFLIGVQETGFIKSKISKEQKQDLMHVAVCSLLSESGYYFLERRDEDGWPHFKQLKEIPQYDLIEQENFLKDHILLYFEKHTF